MTDYLKNKILAYSVDAVLHAKVEIAINLIDQHFQESGVRKMSKLEKHCARLAAIAALTMPVIPPPEKSEGTGR